MNLRTGNAEHDAILDRLPRYTCHKVVQAVQIKLIEPIIGDRDGAQWLTPVERGLGLIKLEAAWIRRHNPAVGGYLVVQLDGHATYSTAEAFEAGYRIGDQGPSPAGGVAPGEMGGVSMGPAAAFEPPLDPPEVPS